jgi:hypothetical protein
VINCFRDEFLPIHQNDEYVDLSDLVDKLKNFTPIPLGYTKLEECIQYVFEQEKRIFFAKTHISIFQKYASSCHQ